MKQAQTAKALPIIWNLTQHKATEDQLTAGVVDVPEHYREALLNMLTFETMPDATLVDISAMQLTGLVLDMAGDYCSQNCLDSIQINVMIGGAPFLMPALTQRLQKVGIKVCCAFSQRVSEEVHNEDGSVTKVNKFKHQGFVWL